MIFTSIIAVLYLVILTFGILGNCWVINSVVRSRRPRSGTLTPSDRLRTYIGLLAVVDFLVILALVIRVIYVLLPNATINTESCKIIYIIDHLVKLTSLTCLTCISVERYITIRKPFSSRVRKRFMQLTPFFAFLILIFILSAIATLSTEVVEDSTHMNCVRRINQFTDVGHKVWGIINTNIARWIVAAGFILQLSTVSFSYSQIVRHVRRKFWQRKARVVANSRTRKQPLIVSEPRYMKDMTAAIVRIAFFHVICWLPYCLMLIIPDSVRMADGARRSLSEYITTSLRFINKENYDDGLAWLAFAGDYLTYMNSAGDWIFYAAMNRDLRSIIRATTERRKRSTMSQHSPSSNLHRSLRRQMTLSLRFFYSINSYRSNGNSIDESCSTVQNVPLVRSASGKLLIGDSPNGSLSPPANNNSNHNNTHKTSTVSISNGFTNNGEGLFGMRNGRAHTYCSPRPQHFGSHGNGQNQVSSPKVNVNCVKQMFFPSTGLSNGVMNGYSNGISQLATRKISNNSNAITQNGCAKRKDNQPQLPNLQQMIPISLPQHKQKSNFANAAASISSIFLMTSKLPPAKKQSTIGKTQKLGCQLHLLHDQNNNSIFASVEEVA